MKTNSIMRALAPFAKFAGALAGTAIIGATMVGTASAQSWPERPIALVVPYPAGGAIDASARRIADFLSAELGQPVVVENRQGANSIVGTTYVAQSEPDGYTFLYTTLVAQAGNLADYDDLPYDTFEDFEAISVIQAPPNVLVAHESVEADTMDELIALAKENPGVVSFGTNGPGSPAHLRGVQFARSGDIDLNLITYPGGAAALADLAGGHLDLYPAQLSTVVSFVEEGDMKILAALGDERLDSLPDIPSITEFEGYENFNELATFPLILAPSGVSQEVIDGMHTAISSVISDNVEYLAMSEAAQEYPPFAATPEEAEAMLNDYIEVVGSLAGE